MLQQSLGDTASLHEIGIEMVAGNLVATPRVSDLFVNFGERIDVSDITGGFMFNTLTLVSGLSRAIPSSSSSLYTA